MSKYLFFILAALCATAEADDFAYQFVDVPFEHATETELFAINNLGVAVGSYLDGSGVRRGFVWDSVADAFTDYGVPGATGTRLFGINDAGTMTGYWQDGPVQHGFQDVAGARTTLDRPGFETNYAWGINNHGDIAGYVFDFGDGFFITSHQLDVETGDYQTVLFNAEGDGTVTRGINDAGVSVGWSLEPVGATPGLIYENGEFSTFSLGADRSTLPNDINNLGQIVGNVANLEFRESRGFLRATDGSVSLLHVPGAEFTQALGMNDQGLIVGSFHDADHNTRGYLARPVPEPSSMTIAMLGLLTTGLLRRGRK